MKLKISEALEPRSLDLQSNELDRRMNWTSPFTVF